MMALVKRRFLAPVSISPLASTVTNYFLSFLSVALFPFYNLLRASLASQPYRGLVEY